MTKEKELKDEELDKVAGGVPVKKVYDVKANVLYKSKWNNTDYAYVTSFTGMSNGHVLFRQGTLQSDGYVHKNDNSLDSRIYTSFIEPYDVNSTLSSDYWVE